MATIAEIRAQYPQYEDMSDQQLADALYAKHYSDMPRREFNRKVGIEAAPPTGPKPGSKEYANWALSQVKGGKSVPMVSEHTEWAPPTAKSTYEKRLAEVREAYYPGLTDEQWQKSVEAGITNLKPADAGGLLNDGLTMGLSDEARGAAGFMTALTQGKNPLQGFTDFQQFEQSRRDYGAEQAGPMGTAAQIGGAVLAGRPDMAATRAVGALPAMLQGARQGATQGAIYGAASTEGDLIDRAIGGLSGAATGGVLGAAVPAVVSGVKRVISPMGGRAGKIGPANILANEGVELTAGQRTGSKGLQYRESELGGVAAENFMEQQADQFTAAALRRIGVNAPRATHDVIDGAATAIGQRFDDLAALTNTPFDNTLQNNLLDAAADYADTAGTPAPIVERMVNRLGEMARTNGGRLTGDMYQEVRSTVGRLSKNADPATRGALRELQEALDDGIERHLSGQTLQAWQEARGLWRNFLVIEDSATRAGEKAADGIITPQALRGAAIKQNKRAYSRGRNDFVELADAGVSALAPLPNSGTAGRLGAKLFVPAGAATGATIGSLIAPGLGTAAGAALGAAVPWGAGRLMLSGPGRAYLGNQVAGPVTDLTSRLGSLLGRGAQPLVPSPAK
jgi:hypothetical protein